MDDAPVEGLAPVLFCEDDVSDVPEPPPLPDVPEPSEEPPSEDPAPPDPASRLVDPPVDALPDPRESVR